MIFRWWKNATYVLKFLSTYEHNQCEIHLSPSSFRMASKRSILISLPSQVEPRCTLLISYTPFLQFRGDPPTSFVYVKLITPLSLHQYSYIDHYQFSTFLMLAHKQIKENMVTRHQKSVDKHMSIITTCISCNLNDINHEHGKCIAQQVHLGHWMN
jgi:hypothetical protein